MLLIYIPSENLRLMPNIYIAYSIYWLFKFRKAIQCFDKSYKIDHNGKKENEIRIATSVIKLTIYPLNFLTW